MSLRFTLVTKKTELFQYKKSILGLFLKCFGKELDEKFWDWAYLKNPIGEPIVSLCFNSKNVLVGHYAVVPYLLEHRKQNIKVALSMTSMVDIEYRHEGFFMKQALSVYESASKENYKMIIAFPNKKSAPVFKAFLGWKIEPLCYIVEVTKEELSNSLELKNHLLNENVYEFAKNNTEFLNWRLSKPNCTYHLKETAILKDFEKNQDIVLLSNDFEKDLEDGKKYNILVDGSWKDLIKRDSTEYQFGYKLFDQSLETFKIKKDLILSDVF